MQYLLLLVSLDALCIVVLSSLTVFLSVCLQGVSLLTFGGCAVDFGFVGLVRRNARIVLILCSCCDSLSLFLYPYVCVYAAIQLPDPRARLGLNELTFGPPELIFEDIHINRSSPACLCNHSLVLRT